MKDKVLILASVASMIDQFNMSNIDILISLGYEVMLPVTLKRQYMFAGENSTAKEKTWRNRS